MEPDVCICSLISDLGVSLGAGASREKQHRSGDYANIGVTGFKISRLPSVLVTQKYHLSVDCQVLIETFDYLLNVKQKHTGPCIISVSYNRRTGRCDPLISRPL